MKNYLLKRFFSFIDFASSSQIVFTLFAEITIGIMLLLGNLFIFLKFADKILDKDVIFFDGIVTTLLYSFRTPALTDFMKFVTFFGGEVCIGIGILLTIIFLLRSYPREAAVFSFILFFGIALNFLLKSMFQRPRPTFLPLVQENFYSFPSGHAMNSFIFYTSLSFFIFRRIRNKYLRIGLIFLSMMFILLIGISRVYLGAHYASDVVAGYVTGFLWFVLVLFFEKSLVFLKLFKRYRAYSKRTYYF